MASNLNTGKPLTPASRSESARRLTYILFGNRFHPGLIKQVVSYVLLFVLTALFLLPFYWLVNTALKSGDLVYTIPPTWLPNPPIWRNFIDAATRSYVGSQSSGMQVPPMVRYALNTSLITLNGVVATLLSSSLVAYAFARLRFPGKNFLFLGILSTLMIPFAVVMVPQYILWTKIGWIDTFLPLMIPQWFGSAYNIFLLSQFFMSIPMDYDELAIIDGATHWDIFWKIIIPLSRPALAAVGVFAFVFFWNDFLGPLIILSSPEKFTLTMYLTNFRMPQQTVTPYNLYMAAALMITLPCLILFFFSQNIFMKGITIVDFKR
ncbi:MAG: carbohydrate ABC transporter permease [Anaerolineaceae bacterium]